MLHYYTHRTPASTLDPPHFDAANPSDARVKDLAIDSDDGTAAVDAYRAPVPALAAPVRLRLGAATADNRLPLAALVLAVMAHAAILYVLAREPDEAMLGAGGHEIDAISVTLVDSKVLESRDTTLSHPTAQASPSSLATP